MEVKHPLHCRAKAFEHFAAQVTALDRPGALLRAATAISTHEMTAVDVDTVVGRVQDLAHRVRARVRGNHKKALVAYLHQVLFEEEQLLGNAEDYYNPFNSYVPAVLETKRGLPITLSLIYKSVAERIGLRAVGINAPMHFMAAVEINGSLMMVDPFSGGRALSREEAVEMLESVIGRRIADPDQLLTNATNRQWLERMLNNLQVIFHATRRSHDVAAMQEFRDLLGD